MEHWVWVIEQLRAVRWKWIRKRRQQSWSVGLFFRTTVHECLTHCVKQLPFVVSVLPQAFYFKESVFWAYITRICPPARNNVTESSQVFVTAETIFCDPIFRSNRLTWKVLCEVSLPEWQRWRWLPAWMWTAFPTLLGCVYCSSN